jgi:hypothetical protein
LVKDGATAIEALGDGIDTSLVDLKGGLTGQVLAKTTNTDMDFTWVTTDDANAIQNAIVNAKGDIIGASANDVPAITSVGANGETLVADSSTSTGLRWQVPKMVNAIINGNFDIWARGTTFSNISTATFTADRFKSATAGTSVNCNVTQQTDVPNASSEYSLEVKQLTSNATSVTDYNIRQPIEQFTILPLLGKTLVLSFWYKSNKTGSHGFRAIGTYNTGGTDQTGTFTVSAADTWEFKTISITAVSAVSASSATINDIGLILDIGFRVSGNGFSSISANDYYRISQIQLEVGSVATPFARAGGTIQGELAACQRYYLNLARGTGKALGIVSYYNASSLHLGVSYPVEMRTAPTIDQVAGTNYFGVFNDGATRNISGSWTLADVSTRAVRIYATSDTAATGQAGFAVTSNASAVLALSAEL